MAVSGAALVLGCMTGIRQMAKQVRRRTLEKRGARINFRAKEALHNDLMELARRDGRSLSAYVERVLEHHVRSNSASRHKS